METEFLKGMNERMIKNFMDVLVLTKLRDKTMSGYDVIRSIHKEFGLLVSSGTVYSLLYSLERNGLITGMRYPGKRLYTLTDKGNKELRGILKAKEGILGMMEVLLNGGKHA